MIQAFRDARTAVTAIQDVLDPDVSNAGDVAMWTTTAQTIVALRQTLIDTSSALWNDRHNVGDPLDRDHTLRYLGNLRDAQQVLRDALTAHILDITHQSDDTDDAPDAPHAPDTTDEDQQNDDTADTAAAAAARILSGILSLDWVPQGSTGSGGNDKPITTYTKMVNGNIVDVRHAHLLAHRMLFSLTAS